MFTVELINTIRADDGKQIHEVRIPELSDETNNTKILKLEYPESIEDIERLLNTKENPLPYMHLYSKGRIPGMVLIPEESEFVFADEHLGQVHSSGMSLLMEKIPGEKIENIPMEVKHTNWVDLVSDSVQLIEDYYEADCLHGDLGPHNIILRDDIEKTCLATIDFGFFDFKDTREDRHYIQELGIVISGLFKRDPIRSSWLELLDELDAPSSNDDCENFLDERGLGELVDLHTLQQAGDKLQFIALSVMNFPEESIGLAKYLWEVTSNPDGYTFAEVCAELRNKLNQL